MKKLKISNKILFTTILVILVGLLLFPFYWQLVTSIRNPEEIRSSSISLLPKSIYLGNYIYIFKETKFLTYLSNSFIVSVATTIISIIIATFCSYSLARLNIRGKKFILAFVLSVSIFPGIALVTPLFVVFKKLSLLNTYTGLILPYITFTLPLAI